MVNYDKVKVRDQLTIDDIFQLLIDFGGEPQWAPFGILSKTICHNAPEDNGSYKLYYYKANSMFHCYTGCANPSFDVFELVIKVAKIQWEKDYDLNDAIRWIAQKFGISGDLLEDDGREVLEDWRILSNYERIQQIELTTGNITLKEYDKSILDKFNYNIKLTPWLKEGIKQEVIDKYQIGYYPGGDQITIPHFDINGRLIGLRGRTLCADEGELYGKYRPLRINKITYSHPLGMNLYGLDKNKDTIATLKKAVIYEGEKSVMLMESYFGEQANCSVACCGSNISLFQVNALLDLGVNEIIIAFDRQFQEKGDEEFQHLKNNLLKLRNRYKSSVLISFMFDKNMITGYKSSPIDEGPEKFLELFKERIIL